MAHIITQDTGQGRFYVTAINRRSELVLGSKERSEAHRFDSAKEAQEILDRTPSPKTDTTVIELVNPVTGPWRASSPLGHVLAACEDARPEDLKQLRVALPKHISEDLTDDELWALVKRQTELLIEWPWTIDLLLMIRHTETDHHKAAQIRRRHGHLAERDYETREVIRPSVPKGKHDHNDDLDRLRKEVRNMATATKTKPKAKAREKKEKVQHDCHCGCGGATFANFVPGHDARIYALFRKKGKGETVKFPKVLTDNKELFDSMKAKAH